MQSKYWSSVLDQRLSRRNALAATGATAAAAAFLAACGGNSGTSKTKDSSGLLTPAADTTKQAKRGGVWLDSYNRDVTSFDPLMTNISSSQLSVMAYSQMFATKPGYLGDPVFGVVDGDVVESWEFSPDKLQLTAKLRRNLSWHNLPPVNGRAIDAQDVVYSYKRFAAQGSNRAQYAGELGGPIDSVTALDNSTVVIKLNQVFAAFLAVLSLGPNGNWVIVPKEADNQNSLDIRRTQLGTGPWMLKDYAPSVGFTYARHPGWYAPEHLFVDEIKMPIVPEYATALAQFKSGSIYRYKLRPEDMLAAKKENSALNLYLGPVRTLAGGLQRSGFCFFGHNPALGQKTPFRDTRMRQAFSMSWDRDLWIDTFHNVEKFKAEGFPMESLWNTVVTTTEKGWWLDPKSKDFGPNAKYFEYNVAEAKKLVAAAGYPNGIDVDAQYVTTGEYGVDFNRNVETLMSFGTDVGIRLKTVPINFATEWRPKIADTRGDFEGLSFRTGGIDHPDVPERLGKIAHPVWGGVTYTGFYSQDSSFQKGDPRLTSIIEKARGEFDEKKRIALVQDFQRIFAGEQYILLYPGGSNTFSIAWPALQNENVFFGDQLQYAGLWVDQTKAPIKKA